MSDFIFSNILQEHGRLAQFICDIYHRDPPHVREFHGHWGSLAVSHNMYNGFQPIENDNHIFLIIGGPVLYFENNSFLIKDDSALGTDAVYQRWLDGKIRWDEDLSGPFVVLCIDKKQQEVTCVTDLMSFIPVYEYIDGGKIMLGSHVDVLAKASEQNRAFDFTSIVDFIINSVVTFPYTVYEKVIQITPATVSHFCKDKAKQEQSYWLPIEQNHYDKIADAATALRVGVQDYIARVTVGMNNVAQFISAGEDSRCLAGMLPQEIKRDAYVFLDSMNREGRLARKTAESYRMNFSAQFRGPIHYLEILEEASDLVGMGHQYIHSHSLGFHKECDLYLYQAVFGGFFSDSLLKALYANKIGGSARFPFLPQFFVKGEERTSPISSCVFRNEIRAEINRRRKEHFHKIAKTRKITAHEWFVIWPSTMRLSMPNFYTTRRLFKSYEPFMCKEAVKVGASVPTSWKLNRRLFNIAMKPFLRTSKWIFHADGRLPYFAFWVNIPIQFGIWTYRHVAKRIGLITGEQGPWCDWVATMRSKEWQCAIEKYSVGFEKINDIWNIDNPTDIFKSKHLNLKQEVNLLQTLYKLSL